MKNTLILLILLTLSACGGGGGSSPSTPVTPAPTVSIILSAPKIFIGETVKVSWTSTNATTCTGVDGLAGTQPINGTTNFIPTTGGQFKYTLSCTGASGTSSNTQIVIAEDPIKILAGQISWNQSSGQPSSTYSSEHGAFRLNTGLCTNCVTSYVGSVAGSIDVKNSIVSHAAFTWDAVASSTPGIASFNNVTVGKHPGLITSSSAKFPVQVGTMPNIKVSGDIKVECYTDCVYGSGTFIYITSIDNPTLSWTDNPPIGGAMEIIVHNEQSDAGPGVNHHGYVGNIAIGGAEFKVFYNSFTSKWGNIAYYPVIPSSVLNLNLKEFIQDALNRNYIKPTDFLMSVEIGNEVIFGKGSTTMTNITVM